MREEDTNWFAKWEEELPSPEELMPLSQTLITPDLALAFDIRNPESNSPQHLKTHHNQNNNNPPAVDLTPSSHPNSSAEFENSAELGGTAGSGDEPARTLKRPRLVWTPQLHKRFVDAVAHLGIKNAVPKTIMQLMSVDGLTRENVASHLQKYRLYLKRMQGLSSGGGGGNSSIPALSGVDPATDHLFASSPVPAHLLRGNSEHYMPFVPVAAMSQHHHHHQMPIQLQHQQQQQQQYRHFGSPPSNGQFGSPSNNGQFEHPFLSRQSQQQVQRMGTSVHSTGPMLPSYVDDLESATAANGRKVLTLFPTGDD